MQIYYVYGVAWPCQSAVLQCYCHVALSYLYASVHANVIPFKVGSSQTNNKDRQFVFLLYHIVNGIQIESQSYNQKCLTYYQHTSTRTNSFQSHRSRTSAISEVTYWSHMWRHLMMCSDDHGHYFCSGVVNDGGYMQQRSSYNYKHYQLYLK